MRLPCMEDGYGSAAHEATEKAAQNIANGIKNDSKAMKDFEKHIRKTEESYTKTVKSWAGVATITVNKVTTYDKTVTVTKTMGNSIEGGLLGAKVAYRASDGFTETTETTTTIGCFESTRTTIIEEGVIHLKVGVGKSGLSFGADTTAISASVAESLGLNHGKVHIGFGGIGVGAGIANSASVGFGAEDGSLNLGASFGVGFGVSGIGKGPSVSW